MRKPTDGRRLNGHNGPKIRKPGLLQEYIDSFNLLGDADKVGEHFGVSGNAVRMMFRRNRVQIIHLAVRSKQVAQMTKDLGGGK